MAGPKMTMALASLLLSGAFATTPYCECFSKTAEIFNSSNHRHLTDCLSADCQSTVTAEPQQIGSTTSNGSSPPLSLMWTSQIINAV